MCDHGEIEVEGIQVRERIQGSGYTVLQFWRSWAR